MIIVKEEEKKERKKESRAPSIARGAGPREGVKTPFLWTTVS
jgi:hypothetical protein